MRSDYDNSYLNNDNSVLTRTDSFADAENPLENELIAVNKNTCTKKLIKIGQKCAKLLGATCDSEKLSVSYGKEALRFTCRQGHNFFLPISTVKETYATLINHDNNLSD